MLFNTWLNLIPHTNMFGASHMSKHMCTNQCSSRIHFVSVSKPRCLVHLTRGAVWCSIYCLSQDILASERSSTWCISYCKVILQKRFSAWLSAWSDLELWTPSPLKLKTCSFCSDFVGCWNVWNFGFVPVFAFSPRCDRQRSVNRIGSGCDVLSFLMKRNRGPTFFSGEKNSHISFCKLFCWFIISKTIPCQKKKKPSLQLDGRVGTEGDRTRGSDKMFVQDQEYHAIG